MYVGNAAGMLYDGLKALGNMPDVKLLLAYIIVEKPVNIMRGTNKSIADTKIFDMIFPVMLITRTIAALTSNEAAVKLNAKDSVYVNTPLKNVGKQHIRSELKATLPHIKIIFQKLTAAK